MNEPTLAEETRNEIKGTIQELFLDDIKADFEELKKSSSDSLEKIKEVKLNIYERANAMPEAIASNTEIKDLFSKVVSELKQLIQDKSNPIVNKNLLSETESTLKKEIAELYSQSREEIKNSIQEHVPTEIKQLILDKKHPLVNADHLTATEKNLHTAIGDKHKKVMEEIKKIKTDLKDFATVSDLKKKLNVAYFLIVLQILITLAILVMGIL